MKTSYDVVAEHVRSYWENNHPQDVIAFFSHKYAHDKEWEFCAELASPQSSYDFENVIFEDDFWEGQDEVKDIKIVPLEDIIEFYIDNKEVI